MNVGVNKRSKTQYLRGGRERKRKGEEGRRREKVREGETGRRVIIMRCVNGLRGEIREGEREERRVEGE